MRVPWSLITCLVAAMLVLCCSACSPIKDKQAAEASVKKFHAQLDAEQYHDIYTNASDDFQKSSTESDMTDLFRAIHRKLGAVQKSDETGFHINYTTDGEIITLNYSTPFVTGSGQEQFVWRVGHGQPFLVGYNVNSKELIT